MKELLNWRSKEVALIFDEVTLWSAPFGRLLLEQIPMNKGSSIVDIGFGTGFPLIELSQRFGNQSKIYGIDIWEEGIKRAKDKIKTLELENIKLLEESASKIGISDNQIDLVTSNLGINNFVEKDKVYREIVRILRPYGKLCITTNPIGTFQELFELMKKVMSHMGLEESLLVLREHIKHRKRDEDIISELEAIGLTLVQSHSDTTDMRFVTGKALLNHSLIRLGFRESWEVMIIEEKRREFFNNLVTRIDEAVEKKGAFKMTIPMLYLEFEKQ